MARRTILHSMLLLVLMSGAYNVWAEIPDKFETPPPPGGVRSIYQPFIPMGSPGSLDILCRLSMGAVTIEVQDDAGSVVYAGSILATAGSTWSISVEGWTLGGYTLSFTTATGAVYLWEFELVADED